MSSFIVTSNQENSNSNSKKALYGVRIFLSTFIMACGNELSNAVISGNKMQTHVIHKDLAQQIHRPVITKNFNTKFPVLWRFLKYCMP